MHPLMVEEAIKVKRIKASDLKAAQDAQQAASHSMPSDDLLAQWRKERNMWKQYAKQYYAKKWRKAKAKHNAWTRRVKAMLPPAVTMMDVPHDRDDDSDDAYDKAAFQERLGIVLSG